ncbi:hypothetical protein [Neoroseomonas lacus]|uniref:Uncharacterized protein n=1 Tax=Neoroseomonas lacus TaxID=287609 RepID=A0A917KCU5_9PROT|nr:hypothetical protein [Neoroseomonas lacus]GGJ09512.1 hypothetical protein GCM10011320_15640 [Neoroseomonas lacus]
MATDPGSDRHDMLETGRVQPRRFPGVGLRQAGGHAGSGAPKSPACGIDSAQIGEIAPGDHRIDRVRFGADGGTHRPGNRQKSAARQAAILSAPKQRFGDRATQRHEEQPRQADRARRPQLAQPRPHGIKQSVRLPPVRHGVQQGDDAG